MQTVVAMREAAGTKAPDTLFAAMPGDPTAAAITPTAPTAGRSAFVPVLLGLLALVSWLGHQAWVLDQDRQQLQAAQTALQPTVDKSGGLRRSLDQLASDTQRLADAGNGNARVLVDGLRQRGITINTAAGSGSTTPAAAGAAPGPSR